MKKKSVSGQFKFKCNAKNNKLNYADIGCIVLNMNLQTYQSMNQCPFLSVDEYGHYDEYMMSTYDAPNFLPPAENSNSHSGHDETRKQKLSQLKQLPQQPAAAHDDVTSDQLLTIILPNSFYNSNNLSSNDDNLGASGVGDSAVIDYDAELPKPLKSATVFDYHEISLEDYDWDRIFGEAAAQ